MSLCWTVEDIRNLLDIDPGVSDELINQAMMITVSTIERYCNRKFGRRVDYVETVYKQNGNGWQFHLWPITTEVFVDGEPVTNVKVDNQTGIVWFDQYKHSDMVDVLYTGGYDGCEWPADLLAVLFGSIKNAWDMVNGEVSHTSSISRVTIPDVGTISYDNSTSSSISHGGILIGGIVPQNWQSVLDFYRLHEC